MGSAFSIELFLIVCRDQRTIILAIWRANLRSSTLPKMSASLPHVRQQTSTFISALSYNLQYGFFWQVVLGDPRSAEIIAMREGIRPLIVLVGILINLSEFEYRKLRWAQRWYSSPWKLVPVVNKVKDNILPSKISYSYQRLTIIVILSKCFLMHLPHDWNEAADAIFLLLFFLISEEADTLAKARGSWKPKWWLAFHTFCSQLCSMLTSSRAS